MAEENCDGKVVTTALSDGTLVTNGFKGTVIKITGGHQGQTKGGGKIIPPQGGSGTAPPQGNKDK